MAYTGRGTVGHIYKMGTTAPIWSNIAGSVAVGAVSASVPTGETRTIPTECDIVVVGRYILYGTGALILEGDAHLKVL